VGPVPNCPNLTPSRDPKQHSKLVFQNGTQSEAENTAKPTSKKTHFNKLKETLLQQSKLRINENRKVPSTPWTLYNEVTTILNTWDFESPKTELKWVRYDQNNNTKNNCTKKALQSGFIAKIPQTGTPKPLSELTNALPSKNLTTLPFESPKSDERWESEESLKFWEYCWKSAIYCRFSAIFQQLKTPPGDSDLVRHPVHANEICNHTQFDIPHSTAQSQFPSEVISIKSGSHFHRSF